jgi:hypothetical protein
MGLHSPASKIAGKAQRRDEAPLGHSEPRLRAPAKGVRVNVSRRRELRSPFRSTSPQSSTSKTCRARKNRGASCHTDHRARTLPADHTKVPIRLAYHVPKTTKSNMP